MKRWPLAFRSSTNKFFEGFGRAPLGRQSKAWERGEESENTMTEYFGPLLNIFLLSAIPEVTGRR